MVMSWLWNLMMLEVSDAYMFLETTMDIWGMCRQTYSKVCDAAQIYNTRILTTKQGNHSIIKFSNILQNLWQELDHYQCIEMKCSEDAAILKRFVEKDRIYTFLAGLNAEFDAVKSPSSWKRRPSIIE